MKAKKLLSLVLAILMLVSTVQALGISALAKISETAETLDTLTYGDDVEILSGTYSKLVSTSDCSGWITDDYLFLVSCKTSRLITTIEMHIETNAHYWDGLTTTAGTISTDGSVITISNINSNSFQIGFDCPYEISFDAFTVYTIPVENGYSITYNSNGGTQYDTQTEQTVLPTPLPTPEKTGCLFEGWYYDSSFTNKATAGDTLSDNVTLNARWITLYDDDITVSWESGYTPKVGDSIATVKSKLVYSDTENLDVANVEILNFSGILKDDDELETGEYNIRITLNLKDNTAYRFDGTLDEWELAKEYNGDVNVLGNNVGAIIGDSTAIYSHTNDDAINLFSGWRSPKFTVLPEETKNTKYYAALTLNDKLDINFKASNFGAGFDKEKLLILVNGDEIGFDYDGSNVTAVLSHMASTEMADEIYVTVMYDCITVKEFTYSIKTYCDKAIANNTKEKDLCRAVLTYGYEAQQVFPELTTVEMTPDAAWYNDYSSVNLPKSDKDYNKTDKVSAISANLTLGSAVELNVTVTATEAVTVKLTNQSGKRVDNDNIEITSLGNNKYKITVKNVSASKLSNNYRFEILDTNFFYGVGTYCANKQTDASVGKLCKAVYKYGEAASAYNA